MISEEAKRVVDSLKEKIPSGHPTIYYAPAMPTSGNNGGGMPYVGSSNYSPSTRLYQIISDTDAAFWLREKYEQFHQYLTQRTKSKREDDDSPKYKFIISNGGGMPFGGPTSKHHL